MTAETKKTKKIEIAFVTSNHNKFLECKDILESLCLERDISSIELVHKPYDLVEIQDSAYKCAKHKTNSASSLFPETPILIEDVSLFVEAWDSLPGPYIKWFTKIGVDRLVKMLSPFDNKNAEAVCIYGFSYSDTPDPILFIGRKKGEIVSSRGENGFGFDSIFKPEKQSKTFAEMDTQEKNLMSHRYKALSSFCDWWKDMEKIYG